MANRFILIWHGGRITSRTIRRKPARPYGFKEWLPCAFSTAGRWNAEHFAFRYGGQWHLFSRYSYEPLKSLDASHKAAIEMLLIQKAHQ